MSSFGNVLAEVGEFGPFQKRLLFVLCLPSIFAAFNTIGQVFTGQSFPHRCNTDWILERGNLTEERRRNLTLPLGEDGGYERCRMFTPVDWDLETIEARGINSTSECLHGWDYDKPEGVSSLVTEMDLVCANNGLVEVSQSLYMVGLLLGAPIFGAMSDRLGRRKTILVCLFLLPVTAGATAFSPNIYFFMVVKFFCGLCGAMLMTTSVLGVEWNAPSKSAFCTTSILLVYELGLMLLPFFAYLVGNWRKLQVVLFSPIIVVWGIFYCFVPESARWLLAQGRREEAEQELRRAARVNGRKLADNFLDKVEMEVPSKKGNMLDILRIPYLRKRFILMSLIWISTSLVYYGLSLNVGSFGMNIYITQLVFGAAEVPGSLLSFTLNQRIGRRLTQSGSLIFAGATSLSILAIPRDLPMVITAVAIVGKLAMSASFTNIYVYAAELYPTSLRQNGMGVTAMCGRVGAILSPLVTLLAAYHHAIPLLVYGIMPIVAGGLCFLLPETLNIELPDHAEVKKPKPGPAEKESEEKEFLKA